MNRKFIISLAVLFLSITALFFLWAQPLLLSVLLVGMAYVKHRLYPIKSELLWFVLLCIGGAAAEMLLVGVGGAWSYAAPQLFGIPIWVPPFWGLAGTTMIVMYDGLTERPARVKPKTD